MLGLICGYERWTIWIFFGSAVVACRLESAIGCVKLLLVVVVVMSLFFNLGGNSLVKEI